MTAQVQPGSVLGGKYRVERIIGQGGMGMVVSAIHLGLNQRVALKFLLPEVAQRGDIVARFLREARAATCIKGEHVARVTDVGTLEDGTPYMVMECLEGHDLSAVLARRGPLPVAEVVDYVLQACEAVAEAHAAGIVHRDLKPANLFLTKAPDGSPLVKVLDFGISKVANSGPISELTRSAALMGSPLYMSPEQMCSSHDVDAKADIWALGVVLFELLTGNLPYPGNSVVEICAAALQNPAPSVRALVDDVPVELDAVIHRCLEKKPSARFSTVAELAVALSPFAPEHARPSVGRIVRVMQTLANRVNPQPGHGEPPHPFSGAPTGVAWGAASRPVQRTGRRLARSSRRALGASAIVLVLGAAGVGVIRRRPAHLPVPAVAVAPPVATAVAGAGAPSVPRPELATPMPTETRATTRAGADGGSMARPAPHAAPKPAPKEPVAITVGKSGAKAQSPTSKPVPREAVTVTVVVPTEAALPREDSSSSALPAPSIPPPKKNPIHIEFE